MPSFLSTCKQVNQSEPMKFSKNGLFCGTGVIPVITFQND